jgi:DNA invertase Pin-like site-specific DNA recombinase
MTEAGIYLRLSQDKDSAEATTDAFERQETDCRALCEARGWAVAQVYTDRDLSAWSGKRRPGFEAAVADLAAGRIGALVAWKLDRLARNVWDVLRVEKALTAGDGALVTVKDGWLDTTTSTGRFTLRTLTGVAEMESDNTSTRVKAQVAQAASKGRAHGGGRRPFGYTRRGGELIEEEAQVLREAAQRLLPPHPETLWAVTVWANTVSERTWRQQTLGPALKSPHTAGLRQHRVQVETDPTTGKATYKTETFPGTWEPVLDLATWEAVKKVLNNPKRKRGGRPSERLLSGVLVCGLCGTTMWAHKRPAARGGAYEYICPSAPGRPGCGKLSVVAAPLEDYVTEWVLGRWVVYRERAQVRPQERHEVEQLPALEEQLRALEVVRDALGDAAYETARGRLRAAAARAEAQLRAEVGRRVLVQLPEVESAAEARRTWQGEGIAWRRSVVKALVPNGRIVVEPSRRRRISHPEERVPTLPLPA